MTSTVDSDNATTTTTDDALIALRKPAKRAGRSVRWLKSEIQQWVRNEWRPQAPA
ncbi:hypothetical protein [Stenotrophomonas sp. S41]|uniref:hypothetical protein n=1 Tax=Stenotrophomonas sp. S41 TaxID=2767464 RepID=UPI00190DCC48|nr:hypothetical protein [Stenotrophomonas sp. S41]MBK0011140.1 hypothetical protein [Stenotrophomonas sp. S41]